MQTDLTTQQIEARHALYVAHREGQAITFDHAGATALWMSILEDGKHRVRWEGGVERAAENIEALAASYDQSSKRHAEQSSKGEASYLSIYDRAFAAGLRSATATIEREVQR